MRRCFALLALAPLLLLSTLIRPNALAQGMLDQSNTATPSDFVVTPDDFTVLGQTFTAGITGTLDGAALQLATEGDPVTGTVSVFATNSNGLPAGPALASGTIAVSAFDPLFAPFVSVAFMPAPAVTAGRRYALVLTANGLGSIAWSIGFDNPYPRGEAIVECECGAFFPFFDEPNNADFDFETFVTPPPPAAPATVTLALTPSTPVPGTAATLIAAVGCTTGTPSGTVTFTSNGQVIGVVPVSGGTASLTITVPALGPLVVIATYSGDPKCGPGVSSALTVQGVAPPSAPAIYQVSIGHTGCGTTTPSGLPYLALQNVSITAVPCPGSVFVGWTGGPCDKTTINPCSIPAGVQATANFAP